MHTSYPYETGQTNGSHKYLAEPVRRALARANARTVLDAGCGNGSLTALMRSVGRDVYGVDASPTGIEHARRILGEDRAALVDAEADLRGVFPGVDSWDAVISVEVIEHLYSPRDYVRNIRGVLRAGGSLIVTTPYHGYLKNLALAAAGAMDKHFTALWDGGHIKFWSRATLTKLLSEAGFEVVHFEGCGRAPLLWKSMLLHAVKA